MAERREKLTAEELTRRYAEGEREFPNVDLPRADLGGALLSAANLTGAILSSTKLMRANFSRANLTNADLRDADLTDANLSDADLSRANLRHANLTGTLLFDANLIGANITGASLIGANLSGACLDAAVIEKSVSYRTTWANVNLSSVLGVASVQHRGPSSVGIDTILLSGGTIPDAFLRGCGVPEHIVDLQRSLVQGMAPIQFYSAFISYSHSDEEFARRLHGRLQHAGLRVWYAPEEMKAGRKLHEQIDDAIRVHDKLLLVLSKASMSSEWVATEVTKARRRQRQDGKQVLFPIRLVEFEAIREWECFDADAGKDSAREIREYFIPDFSNWKDHDAFEVAFARLLKDLRASAA
jgi:uncharacterized protein YjbI with pentapeptide repeats